MTGVKELYPFLAALKVQCIRLQKAKCMTRVGEQMAQFDSVDMIIIYEENSGTYYFVINATLY